MSSSDANEYDFSRRSKSGRPGFESFTDEAGKQHYFHVNDMEGNALLYSQAYSTVQARDTGIASVTTNAVKPDRYERITNDGQPYFIIRAGNMKEVARSRYFANAADMDRSIAWLQGLDFSNISGTLAAAAGAVGGAVGAAADAVGDAVESAVDTVKDAGAAAGRTAANLADDAGDAIAGAASTGMRWLWWLIPLLLLLLLLWALRGCIGDAAETVGEAATTAVDAAGDAASAVGDAAGAAVDATGEAISDAAGAVASMFDFENAPTWQDLGLPEGGVLAGFIDFLKGGGELTRTFTLDRVKFETDSATLREGSMDQLDNVVKILNAYTSISLELQGHTDNTGDYAANKELSQQRANVVMEYLISKGISADRLTAMGYGSDMPLATNDTAEGRRQNRRTDLQVTRK